jgi:LPS export ABC transporter protein LptC
MADGKKGLKLTLAVVVVLSLSAVLWTFVQFRGQRSTPTLKVPKMASKAVMALSRVHQTATKDGAVQWKLDAASAELEAGTGIMILHSPEILFFMNDGTSVRLTAKQGKLNTRNNDMHVHGDVVLRNDQYTLVTETLSYAHQRRVLTADHSVKIIGDALRLQAVDMIYNLNTNQAEFSGRVKGTLDENFAL